jgi:elongator complex protein 3
MDKYYFEPQKYEKELLAILQKVDGKKNLTKEELSSIMKQHPKDKSEIFAKDQLVQGYYYLIGLGKLEEDDSLLTKIRMKPTRTVSGVVPVTILTRPFPCPGKCIFCPNDVRMPKSYLSDEPGAQRAERNHFDPYLQTYNRLLAYKNTGHPVSKIEIIILGGTWSYYPEKYQVWFIKRCFEALNDFGVRDRRTEVHTKNIYEAEEKFITN